MSWIFFMSLNCLVHGKSTDEKIFHKHIKKVEDSSAHKKYTLEKSTHAHIKSKGKSDREGLDNGVRKDFLSSLQEFPVPVQIEHLKDLPVPVPVKKEVGENVLHVHIHDRKYFFFLCLFTIYVILLRAAET